MSTLTHPVPQAPRAGQSLLRRCSAVLLFWGLAAVPVIAIDAAVDTLTPLGAIAVKIAAIVAVAWLYVRFTARNCSVDHALFVGLTWLLLDIATEIATTTYLGHGWFNLIGAPENHVIRDVLLFTWIGAPALFAQFSGDARS